MLTADELVESSPKAGCVWLEPASPPERTGSIYYADRYAPMQAWGLVHKVGRTLYPPGFAEGALVIYDRRAAADLETSDRAMISLIGFQYIVALITEAKEIVPLRDWVLIIPDSNPEVSEGGILLPERRQSEEPADRGTVISLGPLVSGLNPGDKVLYEPYEAIEVTADGKDKILVQECDVIAVIEE